MAALNSAAAGSGSATAGAGGDKSVAGGLGAFGALGMEQKEVQKPPKELTLEAGRVVELWATVERSLLLHTGLCGVVNLEVTAVVFRCFLCLFVLWSEGTWVKSTFETDLRQLAPVNTRSKGGAHVSRV